MNFVERKEEGMITRLMKHVIKERIKQRRACYTEVICGFTSLVILLYIIYLRNLRVPSLPSFTFSFSDPIQQNEPLRGCIMQNQDSLQHVALCIRDFAYRCARMEPSPPECTSEWYSKDGEARKCIVVDGAQEKDGLTVLWIMCENQLYSWLR